LLLAEFAGAIEDTGLGAFSFVVSLLALSRSEQRPMPGDEGGTYAVEAGSHLTWVGAITSEVTDLRG
jgi:hypothetical protein